MPITVAHDATHANIAHLPAGQVCGYTTGTADIRWTAHDWTAHPHAVRIDQDAAASDLTADVLDVERGAAANSEAAHWYTMALRSYTAGTRPGQRHPAIYTSASNVTPLVNALIAGGVKSGPGLWVANWNLSDPQAAAAVAAASGPYPVIGVQFSSGPFYDTSVFSTTWLSTGSVMAGTGPYLHHADGTHSLAEIAAARNTTAERLIGTTLAALTAADRKQIAALTLPPGWPYYTVNP
jgi:hypothetical protein